MAHRKGSPLVTPPRPKPVREPAARRGLGTLRLPPGSKIPGRVGEWFTHATQVEGAPAVQLRPPRDRRMFVDPTLDVGLEWWSSLANKRVAPQSILMTQMVRGNVELALSDAWTALVLTRVLRDTPGEILVLQADYHRDLAPPLLLVEGDRHRDPMTNEYVLADDPRSIEGSIRSGAIGMGSCLTLAARDERFTIRRLRHLTNSRHADDGWRSLVGVDVPWTLLGPSARSPGVEVHPSQKGARYLVTQDPLEWVSDISDDTEIVVHIDADVLNNRFNWDSDWSENPDRHDPGRSKVGDRLDSMLDALEGIGRKVAALQVTLSPGFFPGEFWSEFNPSRMERLSAIVRPSPSDAIKPEPSLRPSKSTRAAQGSPPRVTLQPSKRNRLHWKILVDGTSAGLVKIDEASPGHWTIYIKVNQDRRGQGIASNAYALAATDSRLPEVWAHMAKKNVASKKAAMNAGFVEVDDPKERQLLLRWTRPTDG